MCNHLSDRPWLGEIHPLDRILNLAQSVQVLFSHTEGIVKGVNDFLFVPL